MTCSNRTSMATFHSPAASLPFDATLKTLQDTVPAHLLHAKVGIVCGSGLSTLAASLRDVVFVPYGSLEGFTRSTGIAPFLISLRFRWTRIRSDPCFIRSVSGHKSMLAFGLIGSGEGVPVVAMLGRVSRYNGFTMPFRTVVLPASFTRMRGMPCLPLFIQYGLWRVSGYST